MGGVCTNTAQQFPLAGEPVGTITTECSVTLSGQYSGCIARPSSTPPRFSCSIRPSAGVQCTRSLANALPGVTAPDAWVRFGDFSQFETLAECISAPAALPAEVGVRVQLQPAHERPGTVLVRESGKGSLEPLTGRLMVAPGTVVDARNGTVYMLAAKPETRGGRSVHVASFTGGVFSIHQKKGSDGLVELRLSGSSNCKSTRTGSGRRLTGEMGGGSGLFRIRGRNASALATLSLTRWVVHDRCDRSTLVAARRKNVKVRDLVRRKDLRIHAPKSYIARPSGR